MSESILRENQQRQALRFRGSTFNYLCNNISLIHFLKTYLRKLTQKINSIRGCSYTKTQLVFFGKNLKNKLCLYASTTYQVIIPSKPLSIYYFTQILKTWLFFTNYRKSMTEPMKGFIEHPTINQEVKQILFLNNQKLNCIEKTVESN